MELGLDLKLRSWSWNWSWNLWSWNWSWSWNLRSWSWSWSWYSGDLPELELELELKPPELELELELIFWRLAGVGVGVGVETSGVGVGVGVDIMELTPTLPTAPIPGFIDSTFLYIKNRQQHKQRTGQQCTTITTQQKGVGKKHHDIWWNTIDKVWVKNLSRKTITRIAIKITTAITKPKIQEKLHYQILNDI